MGDQPTMETRRKAPITLTPTYVNLQVIGAPVIQLAKHTKYPIPLLSMSEDVLEEGALLRQISNLKYHDYNLLDLKKFPQFQADRYMYKKIDPVTQVEVLAP